MLDFFLVYIIRPLPLVLLFIILFDWSWRKHSFTLSYTIIRIILILNWMITIALFVNASNDVHAHLSRATGTYWWAYFITFLCSVLLPFLLLFRKVGKLKGLILTVALLVNIGYYMETFIILVTTFHQDYFPSVNYFGFILGLLIRGMIPFLFLAGMEIIRFRFVPEKRSNFEYENIIDN